MGTNSIGKSWTSRYKTSKTTKDAQINQEELLNDVKKYVQGCQKCQQNNVQHIEKAEELYSLEIPQRLWQEVNINIIGLLLRSNVKNAIVVIVDQFTKIIRLSATTTVILLEKIAKIYRNDMENSWSSEEDY